MFVYVHNHETLNVLRYIFELALFRNNLAMAGSALKRLMAEYKRMNLCTRLITYFLIVISFRDKGIRFS